MTDRPVAQIRIATPEDAQALGAMHVTSWRETYLGLLPDKMLSSLSVESRAAAWPKIMQEPATERSTVVYLAEHQESIIGFGSCGAQRTASSKDKGYDKSRAVACKPTACCTAIYPIRKFLRDVRRISWPQ